MVRVIVGALFVSAAFSLEDSLSLLQTQATMHSVQDPHDPTEENEVSGSSDEPLSPKEERQAAKAAAKAAARAAKDAAKTTARTARSSANDDAKALKIAVRAECQAFMAEVKSKKDAVKSARQAAKAARALLKAAKAELQIAKTAAVEGCPEKEEKVPKIPMVGYEMLDCTDGWAAGNANGVMEIRIPGATDAADCVKKARASPQCGSLCNGLGSPSDCYGLSTYGNANGVSFWNPTGPNAALGLQGDPNYCSCEGGIDQSGPGWSYIVSLKESVQAWGYSPDLDWITCVLSRHGTQPAHSAKGASVGRMK